jgi:hypothetical protein
MFRVSAFFFFGFPLNIFVQLYVRWKKKFKATTSTEWTLHNRQPCATQINTYDPRFGLVLFFMFVLEAAREKCESVLKLSKGEVIAKVP